MSAITVVTTFHPAGLTKYGQRFLDSFALQVDKRIKLLVYAEDCKPINPDPTRIEILDAKDALPKLNADSTIGWKWWFVSTKQATATSYFIL